MSDTKPHVHTGDPIEPDDISFNGITWFVIILTATVIASQVIVWGLFLWYDYRVTRDDAPRAPLAAPPGTPSIDRGRVLSGVDASPMPGLLVDEPMVLHEYRDAHRQAQEQYGWVDQAMGTVRLPIERAKDLVLERGLPVRSAPTAEQPAAAEPATEGVQPTVGQPSAEPAGAAAGPAGGQ